MLYFGKLPVRLKKFRRVSTAVAAPIAITLEETRNSQRHHLLNRALTFRSDATPHLQVRHQSDIFVAPASKLCLLPTVPCEKNLIPWLANCSALLIRNGEEYCEWLHSVWLSAY